MDPVSTALIAALTGGLTQAVKNSINDAYGALKKALSKGRGDNSDLIKTVDKLEADPGSDELRAALSDKIAREKLADQEDIQRLAAALIEALKQTMEGRAAVSKFTVKAGKIGVVGDGNTINNINLTATPPPKIPKELTARIHDLANTPVGRDDDLRDLHQRLFTAGQVLLVNGIGGVGKTTLAQAYVNKHWNDYRHIAWITHSGQFDQDVVTCEGLLETLGLQAGGGDNRELCIAVMRQWQTLADGEQPNLLVIDNAEAELHHWRDYLPHQPQWHILATSRVEIEHFSLKELDFLPPKESVNLFLRHYTRSALSRGEIEALVALVDYHTLTVEILAKTAQYQRTPLAQLKTALEQDLSTAVHIPHKGDKIERITSYLRSIFEIGRLEGDEAWLLCQCLCLPPEFHPYQRLAALIDPSATGREGSFAATMSDLKQKGWLLENPATDGYKMHRIVGEVLVGQLEFDLDDIEPLVENITGKLLMDYSKDNPIDKFEWIPFGQSLLRYFGDSNEAAIATLQNNLALRLQDLGDYEGAKGLLEKALASDKQNFGEAHPITAIRYSNLAMVLKDLGDYKTALELASKAYTIMNHSYPPGHPYIQVVENNLKSIQSALKPTKK